MRAAWTIGLALTLTSGTALAQRPNAPAPESIDIGGGVGLRAGVVGRGQVGKNVGLSSATGAAMLGLSLRANKLLGPLFAAGLSTVGHFHVGGPEGVGLGDWSPVLVHLRFLPASDINPPRQGFYLDATTGVTLLLTSREGSGSSSTSLTPLTQRSIAQPAFTFGFGMGGRWKHFELGGSLMINGGFDAFALSFGMQALFYLPAFPREPAPADEAPSESPFAGPTWLSDRPQPAAPKPTPAPTPPAPLTGPPEGRPTPSPADVVERPALPAAEMVPRPAEGRFVRPLAPVTYAQTASAACEAARSFLLVELTAPFDGHPAGRQLVLRLDRPPRVSVGQRAAFTELRRVGGTSDGLAVYCGSGEGAEAAAPEVRKGRLHVTCSPIGVVSIDGEQVGTARPTLELELPVGPHAVTCTNPELGEVDATIEIRAEQTVAKELAY